MAGASSSLNLVLVFKVLLVIVVLTCSQVMAMREMPQELKVLQQRLILSDIYTCGKHCNTNSDCSEAWVCKTCRYFEYIPTQCDYVWSF